MQNFAHVLSPFHIGCLDVKNRIEFSPACTTLGSPDGYVTKELIAYYQNIAKGGAGIVTIGETPVDYGYAKRHNFLLNLDDEKVIPGLSVLAEAVHKYGAKLSIELNHGGSLVIDDPEAISSSPISPLFAQIIAKAEGRKGTRVIEMTQDMIDDVVDSFASAAERCLRAGLEMIMLHGGHGQLLPQFASAYHNKRTDSYGGSLENRAKFALEVLTEIRNRVGNKLAIEYRISASERIPEGMQVEETLEFVRLIQDKIDLLHVSSGMLSHPEASQYMIQPTYAPHCHNVHYAERFKKELSIPITTIGSISDMQSADNIIAENKADIIAMARAILADPEIVNKTRRGENSEVRPCLRCNACTNLTRDSFPVRCAINPVIGRETEYANIELARKKKKVIIAGGGPAGMVAALTAAYRGHDVILYEKSDKLGGNLVIASGPSFKEDMRLYLAWLVRQLQKEPNIKVLLKSEATIEKIKAENADAVIIAVGADPLIPDIPGVNGSNVVLAEDIHLDRVPTGETVVVAGGGLTGCEAALHLAQNGKKVTVIDMLDQRTLTYDIPRLLMTMLHENRVTYLTEVKLEEITDTAVTVIDKAWKRTDIPAETVVLALGFVPRRAVVDSFRDVVPDVYFIGDCRKPNNIKQAVYDAFNVAAEL